MVGPPAGLPAPPDQPPGPYCPGLWNPDCQVSSMTPLNGKGVEKVYLRSVAHGLGADPGLLSLFLTGGEGPWQTGQPGVGDLPPLPCASPWPGRNVDVFPVQNSPNAKGLTCKVRETSKPRFTLNVRGPLPGQGLSPRGTSVGTATCGPHSHHGLWSAPSSNADTDLHLSVYLGSQTSVKARASKQDVTLARTL